jgi:2-keto-3-deoxy-L-rhamnonate aldolase RhmA
MQSSKPLHEAMREGGLSLGIFGGPGELLGVYREAGFNHIIVDQMFGVMSASEAIDAISRVRAAGLAPIVRVHTYPWSGEASGDMGAAAEVAAARMQGAAGVVVSYSTVDQLKACLHAAADTEHAPVGNRAKMVERWKAGGGHDGGWEAVRNALPEDLRDFPVVACIEDVALMKDIEEVVALPGLRAVGFGMHDITITAGHPFEVDHPDVWAVIDKVVALARPRGISVWANSGYIYTRLDETVARIERMYSRGIDCIQLQSGAHFLAPLLCDVTSRAFANAPTI